MSTMGDRIRGGFPRVGVGISLPPGQPSAQTYQPDDQFDIVYRDWDKGVINEIEPEAAPDGAMLYGTDVDIQRHCLRPAPARTAYPAPTGHQITNIFSQASTSLNEVIEIDAPSIGVTNNNGAWTFTNVGLNSSNLDWGGAANVAGTLIFGNTIKSYTRAPGAVVVTDISAQVVGKVFATAFARTFVGGYTSVASDVAGTPQPLGIAWNAASGSLTDWSGLGAGNQLLISNNLSQDFIVAMVSVGLQALVVLCRHSIWVGYPTGDTNQPVNFQLRVAGVGCLRQQTAVATPYGVMFLSDDGVYLFDLNTAQPVSRAITSILTQDINNTTPHAQGATGAYSTGIAANSGGQTFYHRYYLGFGVNGLSGITYVYDFPDEPGPETILPTNGRWTFRTGGGQYVYSNWDGSILLVNSTPSVSYEDYLLQGGLAAPTFFLPERSKAPSDIYMTTLISVRYMLAPQTVDITFGFPNLTGSNIAIPSTFPSTITRTLPISAGRGFIQIPINQLHIGTIMQVTLQQSKAIFLEQIRRTVKYVGPCLALQK